MMNTRVAWIVSVAAFLVVGGANAVCYCPVVCENCHRNGDFKSEYGRAPCNDLESKNECEQANWELLNKRDTTVTLVESIMINALEAGNFTGLQVGFIRSLLALAVEDERPEGDCSNGLSTDTGLEGTLTHCFSPELLQQCKKVADGVDEYLDGIAPRLQRYVRSTEHQFRDDGTTYLDASRELGLLVPPHDTLHEIMEEIVEVVRVYTSVKTARVRCASFEATTREIAAAPPAFAVTIAIAMTSVLSAFLL